MSLNLKKIEEFSEEKGQENGPTGRKKKDKTWQKNKRGDSKEESNDSPEIPDMGETLGLPGLPTNTVK